MKPSHLDARGLLCPMPVIRTQDQVNSMNPGELLEVSCTDPGALNDIPAWCRINGHTLVETSESGHEIKILIQIGPSND